MGNLLELVAQLPPCLISLEACNPVLTIGREVQAPRPHRQLMAPEVRRLPDERQARLKTMQPTPPRFAEAVTRPDIRFIPVQGHRPADHPSDLTTRGFVEERTALYNRLRASSPNSALCCHKGRTATPRNRAHLGSPSSWANHCVGSALAPPTARHPDRRVRPPISVAARQDLRSKRLMQLPASAPPRQRPHRQPGRWRHGLKNGRQLAAWARADTGTIQQRRQPVWVGSPRWGRLPPASLVMGPGPFWLDWARNRTASAAGRGSGRTAGLLEGRGGHRCQRPAVGRPTAHYGEDFR